MRRVSARVGVLALALHACTGAGEGEDEPLPKGWSVVTSDEPGAFLSVTGVDGALWVAGADADGPEGPAEAVLLFDDDVRSGEGPTAIATGLQGDLWWVHALSDSLAYVGGSFGRVARVTRDGDAFTVDVLTEGDDPDVIVFGVLAFAGDSGDDIWAVGGRSGGVDGGFVLRAADGVTFEPEVLPLDGNGYAIWKAAGRARDDVWFVGSDGIALHFDGTSFTLVPTGFPAGSLFTVDAHGDRAWAVGGLGRGVAVSLAADDAIDITPEGDATPPLLGVHRAASGRGMLCGAQGAVYTVASDETVARESTGLQIDEALHSCFVEDDGLAFAVGGRLTAFPLIGGIIVRFVP